MLRAARKYLTGTEYLTGAGCSGIFAPEPARDQKRSAARAPPTRLALVRVVVMFLALLLSKA